MKLSADGSGWVSKEGDSAADPNNRGDTITDVSKVNGEPSDDDLIDTLRSVQNLHRKAIAEIGGYIANAQKAKVNKDPISSPKSLLSNEIRKTPGPRGDAFKINPSNLLAYLREDREKIERELRLEKAVAEERKARDAAKSQLMELTKKQPERPRMPQDRS
jgi:hypothetical protein